MQALEYGERVRAQQSLQPRPSKDAQQPLAHPNPAEELRMQPRENLPYGTYTNEFMVCTFHSLPESIRDFLSPVSIEVLTGRFWPTLFTKPPRSV